jgi:hypothetical protein
LQEPVIFGEFQRTNVSAGIGEKEVKALLES